MSDVAGPFPVLTRYVLGRWCDTSIYWTGHDLRRATLRARGLCIGSTWPPPMPWTLGRLVRLSVAASGVAMVTCAPAASSGDDLPRLPLSGPQANERQRGCRARRRQPGLRGELTPRSEVIPAALPADTAAHPVGDRDHVPVQVRSPRCALAKPLDQPGVQVRGNDHDPLPRWLPAGICTWPR